MSIIFWMINRKINPNFRRLYQMSLFWVGRQKSTASSGQTNSGGLENNSKFE